MKKILSVLLAVCLLAACLPLSASAAGMTDVTVSGTFRNEESLILNQVNAHRANNGKSQLRLSPELTQVARQRAAETSYYFSHTRPDGNPFSSLVNGFCGENIAVGQSSVSQVMAEWIASPGHNENLLRNEFTCMGAGAFVSGNKIFWVQIFGNDSSSSVPQQTGTATFPVNPDSFSPYLEKNSWTLGLGTSTQTPLVCHDNLNNLELPGLKLRLLSTVSSSDSSVVQVTDEGSGYRATAVGLGSCQLLYQVGNQTLYLPVTVTEHCVTLPGDFTMTAGFSQTIRAVTAPEDLPVTWTSSNTNVASVSNDGIVQAHKAGTATIVATTNNNNKYFTASCEVTVIPNEVGNFTLPQDSVEVEVGETYYMDITIDPITTVLSFSYSTDNIVSARDWKSGDTRGIAITGRQTGTTVITVSSFSNTATCNVTVYPKGQKPGGSITPDPGGSITPDPGGSITPDPGGSITPDPDKYTVTFLNPLNMTYSTPKEVVNGQPYGTLPTPSMPGYTFDGWYSDSKFTQQVTADTIVQLTQNQTLYAKMTQEKAVTMTFKNTGSGVTDINPKGGKLDAVLSAPAGKKWTSSTVLIYTTGGTLAGSYSANSNVTTTGEDYTFEMNLSVLSSGTITDGMILNYGDFRLTAGTVYEAEASAVVDGNTYRSERVRFRLTATSAPSPVFTDVASGAFYYEPVQWAVENGVTSGTSATTFSPNNPCDRGQIVTFLWRANGSPEPASQSNPFVDVKSGDYFYKAVLWAKENGITSGTDATHFSPSTYCTRGQAVTFLWRANGQPSGTGSGFSDVKSGDFYYDAVKWATGKSITSGTSSTTFSPGQSCTRGQIVTFLYRDKK